MDAPLGPSHEAGMVSRHTQAVTVLIPAVSTEVRYPRAPVGRRLILFIDAGLSGRGRTRKEVSYAHHLSCIPAPCHAATHAALGRVMRLTHFSDYALRVLMYAAARHERLITIEERPGLQDLSQSPDESGQLS